MKDNLLKLFLLLCWICLFPFLVSAQTKTKIQLYAAEGQTVPVAGVTSTQKFQRTYANATITIFDAGTITLSTIYSTSFGTSKSNPFTATSTGLVFFYGNPGQHYDIRISGSGISTYTLGDMIAPNVGVTGIVNVKTDYGAKGDVRIATTGAMTALSNVLTCSSCAFTSADITKQIDVNTSGAFASDVNGLIANNNQVGTITSIISSTQALLSFNAISSVTNSQVVIGTNDTVAIINAVAAANSSNSYVYFPDGNYAASSFINIPSNQTILGSGNCIITQMGAARNGVSQKYVFKIPDGTSNVSIQNIVIRGTNVNSSQVTSSAAYAFAIWVGTGATAPIRNVLIQNVDMSHLWGMGMRSDGDSGEQSGGDPTVINIKVVSCNIYNNADNGINLNTGGGLVIAFCSITGNGAGAIEFAGSRINVVNCYVARNKQSGVVIGGQGDPGLGVACIVSGNIIEYNGTLATTSGVGVAMGGNTAYGSINNNIIKQNQFAGVQISDNTPNASSLSRNITISNNIIVSNGKNTFAFSTFGIYSGVSGTTIENNEVFDDNISGYGQDIGIHIIGTNADRVLRNNSHNNLARDYNFAGTNTLFVDENTSSVVNIDTNVFTGVVDTSTTTVNWKSGANLFSTNWNGLPIRINSVTYTISTVASKPSGTASFTGTSSISVTRLTGQVFDTDWVGQYFKLGVNYYLISAVADAFHLTLTNSLGIVPTSGNWELLGSTELTLTSTAGSQTNVAYARDANVIFPAVSTRLLTITGSEINTPQILPFDNPLIIDPTTISKIIKITLTGNTTFGSGNCTEGQRLTVIFIQDATGGRSVGTFSQFGNFMTVSSGANTWSVQEFICKATGSSFWVSTSAGSVNQ